MKKTRSFIFLPILILAILADQSVCAQAPATSPAEPQTQSRMPSCFRCTAVAPTKTRVLADGPIILYITSQDASCGINSGTIIVETSNGTAPYSFKLDANPTQTTGYFAVVSAGDHTLVVSDAAGASVTTTVTIGSIFPGPVTPDATVISNAINCSTPTGALSLSPFGGTPPYTFSMDLVNFQTTNIFSGLYSGFYTVYAIDANGCIGKAEPFILGGGCDPNGVNLTNGECHDNGTITETDFNTFGNGPFQYSLDGITYQPTGSFSGLGPGVQQVYIKDKNGKVQIIGFNIAEICQLQIDYVAVSAACGQTDGGLTVTAANGSPPYTYTIDGINYQTSNVFTSLAPGNYSITAKDVSGVTSSVRAVVYDRCPVVETAASAVTCAGSDGVITAAGFKGTAPYQFSIDGINFQVSNSFSGLLAGNYTITIRDALGFTGTTSVTVDNSCLSPLGTATVASCGNNNGTINASTSNGTAPYTFSIDGVNFQSATTFAGLAPGAYTLTVKDAAGLTAKTTVTVTGTPAAGVTAMATPASCLNNDGTINAVGTGSAPLQYALENGVWQNSGFFNALDTGTKTISLRDANGCPASAQVNIPLQNSLLFAAGPDANICEGAAATLNASSNYSSFTWSPTAGLDDPRSLTPLASPAITTTYHLTATTGICTDTGSVTVFVTTAPKVFAGDDTAVLVNQSLQLHAVDAGSNGGEQYLWSPVTGLNNPSIANPIATITQSVLYTVTVTTPDGCKGMDSVFIKAFAVSDILVPSAFTPNGDGHNDVFKASPIGIRNFLYFTVYDRWGNRVFYTTDPAKGWDGFIEGSRAAAGVYVWMAGGEDYSGKAIQRKGTVVLIR